MIVSQLRVGRSVRIVAGTLAGLLGTVVEQGDSSRVLVAVESLQGVFVRIDRTQLAFLDTSPVGDTTPTLPHV
jgi:transcription antitermination factor NusG